MPAPVRAPIAHVDQDPATTSKAITFPAVTAGSRTLLFTYAPAVVTAPAGWTKHSVSSLDLFEIALFWRDNTGLESPADATGVTLTLSGPRALGAISHEHRGLGSILTAQNSEGTSTSADLPSVTTGSGTDVAIFGAVLLSTPAHQVSVSSWTGGYTGQAEGSALPASTEKFEFAGAVVDTATAGGTYAGGAALPEAVFWQSFTVPFTDLDGAPSTWVPGAGGAGLRSRSPARAGRSPMRGRWPHRR